MFAYFVAYQCENQLRGKKRSRAKEAFPSESACTESGKGGTGNFGQVAGQINQTFNTIVNQEVHTQPTEGKASPPRQSTGSSYNKKHPLFG